jgi:hypothetical protein
VKIHSSSLIWQHARHYARIHEGDIAVGFSNQSMENSLALSRIPCVDSDRSRVPIAGRSGNGFYFRCSGEVEHIAARTWMSSVFPLAALLPVKMHLQRAHSGGLPDAISAWAGEKSP